jgi:hypothetical protein
MEVPDLRNIAPDRWRDVMAPLSSLEREETARCPRMGSWGRHAVALAESLGPAPSDETLRLLGGGEPHPLDFDVGLMLDAPAFRGLERAGEMAGLTPAQVARGLVIDGVERVLAERPYDAARAELSP